MKKIERLSLCPNCKSKENASLHTHIISNRIGKFWVECDCGVFSEEYENPVDAIFSWGLIEVEKLQSKIKDLKSRLDFCMTMDKQNQQIIEQTEERIKELESDKHINEIKAQGIDEALELASFDCTAHDDPVSVLEKVEKYAEQLRNKL